MAALSCVLNFLSSRSVALCIKKQISKNKLGDIRILGQVRVVVRVLRFGFRVLGFRVLGS